MSPLELPAAASTNLTTHFTWVQRHTAGMHVEFNPALVLTDSGLPCDTFNAVCRAHLTDANAARAVETAVQYFAERQRPFSWWLSPGDQPENLADLLLAAGLQAADSELAMAADLCPITTGDLTPDGLRIERVRTVGQLADFAAVVAAMWTPPDSDVMTFYRLAASAVLSPDSPLWFYVGYVDDKPIAAAEVTVGQGIAGLYNICTRPDFRRRGYGTVMTRRPLLDARAAGCHTAILQATEQGARIYARLGFEAFGVITEYKPSA